MGQVFGVFRGSLYLQSWPIPRLYQTINDHKRVIVENSFP